MRPADARILRSSAAVAPLRVLTIAASVAQVVLVARSATLVEYGIWASSALVSTIGMLAAAVGAELMNRLATALAVLVPGEADERNRETFVAAVLATAAGSLLMVGAGLAAARFAVPWTAVVNVADAGLLAEARAGATAAFVLQTAAIAPTLAVFGLRAYRENALAAMHLLMTSVLGLALLAAAVGVGARLRVLILLPFLANLLVACSMLALFLRRRGWRVGAADLRRPLARALPLLRRAAWFAAVGMGSAALSAALPWITSLTQGFAAAGSLDLHLRLFMPFLAILSEMLLPLWPAYAEHRARGDWAWLASRVWLSVAAAAGLALAWSAAVAVLGRPILALLLDRDVAAEPAVLVALTALFVPYASLVALSIFLNAIGDLRVQAAAVVTAVIAMPLVSLRLDAACGSTCALGGLALPIAGATLVLAARAFHALARRAG